jgi:hypothetical protein
MSVAVSTWEGRFIALKQKVLAVVAEVCLFLQIMCSAEQNRRNETEIASLRCKNNDLVETVAFLRNKLRSSSSGGPAEEPTGVLRSDSGSQNDQSGPAQTIDPSVLRTPFASEPNLASRGSATADSGGLKLQPPVASPDPVSAEEGVPVDAESPRSSASTSANLGDVQQCAELLRSLCPDASQARFFDEAVHEVLRCVEPHGSQVEYRASIVAMLKRQVRYSLRVSTLDCGMFRQRCFLPDDALKLFVVLGKLRAAEWQKTVHDRLTVLSTQPEQTRAAAMRHMDDEYAVDHDDDLPVCDHVVSRVVVSNEDSTFKVDCQVDAIDVTIGCNRRGDLCLVSFFEEVSVLVGKDDLFKRSLLLIRAWLLYETPAYIDTSVSQYLSESAVCIMVCAIFNQYHARIGSPVQALCLFLAEYSAYDGATQAITLHGIVPLRTDGSSPLSLSDVQEHHLLPAVVLEKYWALFNIQDNTVPFQYGAATLADEINDDLCKGIFPCRGHRIAGSPYYVHYATGAPFNSAQRAYAQPTCRFERGGFNIAHPFLCANMVERLSIRRAQRVQRAVALGAAQFLSVLRRAPSESAHSFVPVMLSFFPVVKGRFGQGFVRPDCVPENSPHFIPLTP